MKEAGVTKPTLYHYFGNKEGLLVSIYDRYFSELTRQLEPVLVYHNDVIRTFQDVTRVYIGYAKKYPMFFWLMNHMRKGPLQSKSRTVVGRFHEQEEHMIQNLMCNISAQHSNLKGQEEFLAHNYLNLVNGFIEIMILESQLDEADEDKIHKLAKQFLYGIFSL